MINAPADTKSNFFRQSGWMMASNLFCGVFMAAAAFTAVNVTPESDYSVFVTILRIFVLITLPAAAIQTMLARQAAAAITDQDRQNVSAMSRGILKLIFWFWIVLMVIAAIFNRQIATLLQTSNPSLIWGMMALILAALCAPVFLGLLQGLQKFLPYGWATILNGLGRFVAIAIGVKAFQISATGATIGACAGFIAAILVSVLPARVAFAPKGGHFDRRKFLKNLALLSAGAGSTLFIINVDMPLVQGRFPSDISRFYAAAETIGIAVVTLCVPIAAVMFPKLVRSRATSSSSDALSLAVTGTLVIGGAAALFCTIFPTVPLRILFFSKPELLKSAPLIPWFMWAMIPVTLYNVLVNNLIARERYGIIPWTAILPIAYAVTLYFFLKNTALEPFAAFTRVIQILMGFSTALMLISVYFSRQASCEENAASRSQAAGAKPS